MLKDIKPLEQIIGVTFKKENLLQSALVHRSYINEHPRFELEHNERLEFLGDAVLELIVTEHLYNHYPNPEGELTNWRASLVNARMLAEIATELGINEFLYLSRGESKDTSAKARNNILANTMESIIGAIYLDQGYPAASGFVHRVVLIKLTDILEKHLYQDPKSRLQEIAQEKFAVTPSYKVMKEEGPDHNRQFVVGVFFGKNEIATGGGTSKQEAQMAAATAALKANNW